MRFFIKGGPLVDSIAKDALILLCILPGPAVTVSGSKETVNGRKLTEAQGNDDDDDDDDLCIVSTPTGFLCVYGDFRGPCNGVC